MHTLCIRFGIMEGQLVDVSFRVLPNKKYKTVMSTVPATCNTKIDFRYRDTKIDDYTSMAISLL